MKNIKYIGMVALATLSFSSCDDFLDADNKSAANESAESFFTANPENLRATVYNDFAGLVNVIKLTDQGADLYINPRGADDGIFSNYIFNSETSDITNYYKNCYNAINHANGLIMYGADKPQLVAEGKFLRNWGYYLLTQQFGAVPYITEFIESSKRDYPRIALDEIYPAMLSELTEIYGSSALPAQDHQGNVSKQAVAALATKVALAYAWDCGTKLNNELDGTYTVTNAQLFNEAAAWAEKAINGVQLTMSFEEKWSPKNEGNAEEIFSIQYDRAGNPGNVADGGHSLMYDYMGYFGDCKKTGQKGTGSGGTNNVSYKSIRLWEPGDQRFYGTFMTTYYNSPVVDGVAGWGTDGYLAYYNCSQSELAKKYIAAKFYPSYTTIDEAKADLEAHSAQTVKVANYGMLKPFAVILGYPSVTRWYFKEDGSLDVEESIETLTFLKDAACSGFSVKKWDDPESDNVTSSNDYRDIVVLHVSDMYLCAAEAYLLGGNDGKALEKINAVRQRAGLPNLGSFGEYTAPYWTSTSFVFNPLDLVLDERARELYAERTRWEDLRRTRQLVRYNVEFARSIESADQMRNANGETKWYRPIPYTEITNNTAMSDADQNPGY